MYGNLVYGAVQQIDFISLLFNELLLASIVSL